MASLQRYRLRPIDVPVNLFISTEFGDPAEASRHWERVLGSGLRAHRVPGNHVTMVLEPLVQELAQKMSMTIAHDRNAV
jgi:thioesterase domain-containing protein